MDWNNPWIWGYAGGVLSLLIQNLLDATGKRIPFRHHNYHWAVGAALFWPMLVVSLLIIGLVGPLGLWLGIGEDDDKKAQKNL